MTGEFPSQPEKSNSLNEPSSKLPIGSLGFDRAELYLFLALSSFFVLTRIAHFVPDYYSLDDYGLIQRDVAQVQMLATRQGRFGLAVIYAFLCNLGASPVSSSSALNIAAILLLAGSAVLAARLWKITSTLPLSFLVGAMMFSHPYLAEVWTFRAAPFFLALPIFLLFFALTRTTRWASIAIGIVATIGALSIYQTALHFAAVAILIGTLIDIGRLATADSTPTLEAKRWAAPLGVLTAGTVLYLITNGVVLRAAHLAFLPYYEATADHLLQGRRIQDFTSTVARLFWTERTFSTQLLNTMLLLILASTVALLLFRLRVRPKSFRLAVLSLALFAVCVPAIFGGLASIGGVWWPAPRRLAAIGVFWAGISAIGWLLTGGRYRQLVLIASCTVLLAFVGISAKVTSDQRRVNQRDKSLANRVIVRLEEHPSFPQLRRLVLIRTPTYWRDITTTAFDLNISALGVSWGYLGVIRESTGLDLEQFRAEDIEQAQQLCINSAKWPASNSATIVNGLGIVCF